MNKYSFIVLDRYNSSKSDVINFRSKLTPKKAFRFIYLKFTEDPEDFYDNEMQQDVRIGTNIVSFDGEEISWILIKT